MITKKAILSKQKAITNLANQAGINYIALFGSVSRGEQTARSDVDFLIKFANSSASYFDLVKVENQLSNLLHTKVSVQTQGTISPLIYPFIKNDLTVIYG